jgi:uncharacterized protein YggE
LEDISQFEDLLASALEAGANHVHGIQFRTTELREHRDRARAQAIKAAREKAVALAEELNQEVGEPRTIREEHSGWWSWYNAWWGSYWSGPMAQTVIQDVRGVPPEAGSTIAPGQITVSARVTVSFELR